MEAGWVRGEVVFKNVLFENSKKKYEKKNLHGCLFSRHSVCLGAGSVWFCVVWQCDSIAASLWYCCVLNPLNDLRSSFQGGLLLLRLTEACQSFSVGPFCLTQPVAPLAKGFDFLQINDLLQRVSSWEAPLRCLAPSSQEWAEQSTTRCTNSLKMRPVFEFTWN